MAEEQTVEVEEKKGSKLKIILVAVLAVVLLVGTLVGTLFFAGAFTKAEPEDPDAALEASADGGHGAPKDAHGDKAKDAHGDKGKDAKGGKDEPPKKKEIPADAQAKFEKSYIDLDSKALVANVSGSKKVMQVSLSLMTLYDDRVTKNVEKHRTALRSAALNVLRQVTEPELTKPDFRIDLAQRLRDRINAELERLEDFGGIEEVFFTEFVYQ